MGVEVTYKCDNCRAESVPISLIGHYEYQIAQGCTPPDEWMAYDPYTGCCYCEECAKRLEALENK